MRPSELCKMFLQIREFFHFFEYTGKIKEEDIEKYLLVDRWCTNFIDSLLNQIKAREEALSEIRTYLQVEIRMLDPNNNNYYAIKSIIDLFNKIHKVLQINKNEINNN